MGLDMYAYFVEEEKCGDSQTDVNTDYLSDDAYWGGFYQLHNWMKALYQKKGGKDDEFNCASVRLNLEDLDALETELNGPNFLMWSNEPVYPHQVLSAREFIERARSAIHEGKVVLYSSWW